MSRMDAGGWLAEQVVQAWLDGLRGQGDEPCPYMRDAEVLAFGLLGGRDADEASRHLVDCAAFRQRFVQASEVGARARGAVALQQLDAMTDDVRQSWTRWASLAIGATDVARGDDRKFIVPLREEPGRCFTATREPIAAIDNSGRFAIDVILDEEPPAASTLEIFLDGGGRTLRLARISVEQRRARGIINCEPLGMRACRIPSRALRRILTTERIDLVASLPTVDTGVAADVVRLWVRVASERECWDWLHDHVQTQGVNWAEALVEEMSATGRLADALRWLAARAREYLAMWRQANIADPENAREIERGVDLVLGRLGTVNLRAPGRNQNADADTETVVQPRRTNRTPPPAPKAD